MNQLTPKNNLRVIFQVAKIVWRVSHDLEQRKQIILFQIS